MKLKLKLDKKTILEFLLQNVEKMVLGVVVLVFLMMLYSSLSSAGHFEKTPKQLQDEVDKIKQRQKEGNVPQSKVEAAVFRLAMKQRVEEKQRDTEVERLKRERDRKLKEIERELDLETVKVQNTFKNWAVWLPPVPPLLVGIVVFAYRRLREREGVSKARLKQSGTHDFVVP